MNLTKILRDSGYDLIDGPIRNHQLLQLWVKRTFDKPELYYAHVNQAFKSDVVLEDIQTIALNVNASQKNSYAFNIGITLLEEILKSFGLGTFDLSAKIKSGRNVTISYDNSVTREYAIGNLESYFSSADFVHPNASLLKNANRNNILIITGTVLAKNLVVDIETDFELDASLVASLNNIADGKLGFTMSNNNRLKMVSVGDAYFPIAVKASRIDFDKNVFKNLTLVTDSRDLF